MPLTVTTDPTLVQSLLLPALEADPVRNNILARIRSAIAAGDGRPWCAHDGAALAVRGRPETPLTLAGEWLDVNDLADAVATLGDLDAIAGPVADVERLADALEARGVRPRGRVDERLFRLDALVEPAAVPGRARLAGDDDVALVAPQFAAFLAEAWGRAEPLDALAEMIRSGIATTARLWVWEDDGRIVSFANGRVPAFGVAGVGPVYTPPDLRGRGYASAVTAAASADILAAGAVPVLYTDLANPTSNRIYQALGYRPVDDRLHLQYR
jgi:GNAT superfamily N-acetyltransferase